MPASRSESRKAWVPDNRIRSTRSVRAGSSALIWSAQRGAWQNSSRIVVQRKERASRGCDTIEGYAQLGRHDGETRLFALRAGLPAHHTQHPGFKCGRVMDEGQQTRIGGGGQGEGIQKVLVW